MCALRPWENPLQWKRCKNCGSEEGRHQGETALVRKQSRYCSVAGTAQRGGEWITRTASNTPGRIKDKAKDLASRTSYWVSSSVRACRAWCGHVGHSQGNRKKGERSAGAPALPLPDCRAPSVHKVDGTSKRTLRKQAVEKTLQAEMAAGDTELATLQCDTQELQAEAAQVQQTNADSVANKPQKLSWPILMLGWCGWRRGSSATPDCSDSSSPSSAEKVSGTATASPGTPSGVGGSPGSPGAVGSDPCLTQQQNPPHDKVRVGSRPASAFPARPHSRQLYHLWWHRLSTHRLSRSVIPDASTSPAASGHKSYSSLANDAEVGSISGGAVLAVRTASVPSAGRLGDVLSFSVCHVTDHGDEPLNQAILEVMLRHGYAAGLPFVGGGN